MKILVINTGSSSIKYLLFDMQKEEAVISGLLEKIGEKSSVLTHKYKKGTEKPQIIIQKNPISNHAQGLAQIVDLLTDTKNGIIQDKSEITAVGHRVVHGGESFQASTIIDDNVIKVIEQNIPLAPLHNPSNLSGIQVAKKIFPNAFQVAVFDTAFHQSLPPRAYLYALPHHLYTKERVRRYGFHGISHAFITKKTAQFLDKPETKINLISIHLGNGASMTAVKNGKSIDTTMGLTPLGGLVMGTRCGDIDPALPFFLNQNLDMDFNRINILLNKESGIKGLCGLKDMREVETRALAGDQPAQTALDVYTYRIKKYIGAYYAILGKMDAIVFTAGIGENSPLIRSMSCSGLDKLGIKIDSDENEKQLDVPREISSIDSKIKVLIIPTNEESLIALETKRIVQVSQK